MRVLPQLTVGHGVIALAEACARLSQILMLAGELEESILWGRRALHLAESIGGDAEPVAIHALNSVGSARVVGGITSGWSELEESLRRAEAAESEAGISRALINIIASAALNRAYDVLDPHYERAVAFARKRDLDLTEYRMAGDFAESLLERGRWQEAEALARRMTAISGRSPAGRLQGLRVLGTLAVRREIRRAGSFWTTRSRASIRCSRSPKSSRSLCLTCGCAVVRCNKWTRNETRAAADRT